MNTTRENHSDGERAGETGFSSSSDNAVGQVVPRPLRRLTAPVLMGAAVVLCLVVLGLSLVFVDESEYVIVERFGEIVAVYDRPADRGLRFKLPWPIDTVRRFDRRVRLFEPPAREAFTSDKKNVTVAVYICWKIAEPAEETGDAADRPVVRFFRNLNTPRVAEDRLDARVRSLLNTRLGRISLSQLLAVSDSQTGPDGWQTGLLARLADEIRRELETGRDGRKGLTSELGIEIVDLRIRRINFPTGNRQAVYERMRSERKKEADQYRTAGLAANKTIRSRADLQYERVLAQARADAERIRGLAEAEAIAIRNAAHARDPEFYIALRTLQTYKKILNEKTTLVLSASSQLLKMLTDGIPASKQTQPKQALPEKTRPQKAVSTRVQAEQGKTKTEPGKVRTDAPKTKPRPGKTAPDQSPPKRPVAAKIPAGHSSAKTPAAEGRP